MFGWGHGSDRCWDAAGLSLWGPAASSQAPTRELQEPPAKLEAQAPLPRGGFEFSPYTVP